MRDKSKFNQTGYLMLCRSSVYLEINKWQSIDLLTPNGNMESKENNIIECPVCWGEISRGIRQKAERLNKSTKVKQANVGNYR